MQTFEPKELTAGWPSRTQRSALRYLKKRGWTAGAITIGLPLLDGVLGIWELTPLLGAGFIFAAYVAACRASGSWGRHIPMAIIMAVAGLLAGGIGLLAGPPRGDWGLPLASFSAGVAKVGIILMIFHIIGMILSVMRVLAGGDVKTGYFSNPCAVFLHADYGAPYLKSCKLGQIGIEMNLVQLAMLLIPVTLASVVFPLAIFIMFWWRAITEEIFKGPQAESAEPTRVPVSSGNPQTSMK